METNLRYLIQQSVNYIAKKLKLQKICVACTQRTSNAHFHCRLPAPSSIHQIKKVCSLRCTRGIRRLQPGLTLGAARAVSEPHCGGGEGGLRRSPVDLHAAWSLLQTVLILESKC